MRNFYSQVTGSQFLLQSDEQLFDSAQSELQDFPQGCLKQQRGNHCVNFTQIDGYFVIPHVSFALEVAFVFFLLNRCFGKQQGTLGSSVSRGVGYR